MPPVISPLLQNQILLRLCLISDQSMSACLVLSTAGGTGGTAVSIKLSWGESPERYSRLLCRQRKSGEVITIFNFPVAGTYRYSANNFSETFMPGITGSPARVELNVNGNIALFTPPPGENNNLTWDVFEFVVADDGSFNVSPINTWSASPP